MNTLSKISFHFVKKFLTKIQIYLWHLLIFSHCLQRYPWIKQFIFVLFWFFINRRKLKALQISFQCITNINGQKLFLSLRPKYYHRHVNDIFHMFASIDHVQKYLKYINSPSQYSTKIVKKNSVIKIFSWTYLS